MRDVSQTTGSSTSTLKRLPSGTPSSTAYVHHQTQKYRFDIVAGARRGDGFRSPTNYAACDYTVRSHGFSCEVKFVTGHLYEYSGVSSTSEAGERLDYYGCAGTSPPLATVSQNLANRVDVEVLNRLNGGRLDLGTALGELKETSKFVYDSAMFILKLLRMLLGGSVKKFLKSIGMSKKTIRRDGQKLPGQIWLMYQYALMPLINDIHAAIDTVNNKFGQYPPLMSTKYSADEPIPQPSSFAKNEKVQGLALRGREVKLWYTASNSWIAGLQGLGLLNPAAIIWELTTLSFVVDWFIPIGRWLEALSAEFGLDFYTGYQTSYVKVDAEATYFRDGYNNLVSGNPPKLTIKGKAMRRIVLTSFPNVKPYFKLPDLGGSQILSLIALMQQRAS